MTNQSSTAQDVAIDVGASSLSDIKRSPTWTVMGGRSEVQTREATWWDLFVPSAGVLAGTAIAGGLSAGVLGIWWPTHWVPYSVALVLAYVGGAVAGGVGADLVQQRSFAATHQQTQPEGLLHE